MQINYYEQDCQYCAAVESHLRLHGRLPPDGRFRLVFNGNSGKFGGYVISPGRFGPVYDLIEEFPAPPCIMFDQGEPVPTLAFWVHALRPQWQQAQAIQKRRREKASAQRLAKEWALDERKETVRIIRRVRGSSDAHAKMIEAGSVPFSPSAENPELHDMMTRKLKEAQRARDTVTAVPKPGQPSHKA